MSDDGIDGIDGVVRRLALREHQGRPAADLVAGRRYAAPIEDVWDAITNPERIPRWLLPVSGDLRAGGRYQLQGNAGGVIRECVPPRRLALTWEFGGGVSWVEAVLAPADGGTDLELRHVNHIDDHWDEYGPGAVGLGWDLALLGLELYLAGKPLDPAEAAAFGGTPEGRAYIAASSEAWRAASVAAGTDPERAGAAAERCLAAYTA
ncbi:activator of HSP90 ATPase [Pilimelia anulata]|uniref:Activator of HSP90 ATPase n=1 Tax=Pilimelia anulata TaxID=53371 RepID=A0A8J3B2V9_9ACTN|nr:SRPBCC family protein [Pilimelia anulata]GGJ88622.1 activator of HSP90 ATPase [Pilimelia anulata]